MTKEATPDEGRGRKAREPRDAAVGGETGSPAGAAASGPPAAPVPRTEEEVLDKLMARVAQELRRPREKISPDKPFTDYGLDSLSAETISSELEEWLGVPVNAEMLWDHPTGRELSRHLAGLTAGDSEAD